jgi:hypothetical protein
MKLLENQMVEAILKCMDSNLSWKEDNTCVYSLTPKRGFAREVRVILYESTIAKLRLKGNAWELILDNCGWKTATTHSRLNAIISITGLDDKFTYNNCQPRTFRMNDFQVWERVNS